MRSTTWWIYLVLCRHGEIYTGIGKDVARRLAEHRAGGARGAKFLRGRGPLRLLISQPVGGRSLALRVEARVKKLPPARKAYFAAHPDALQAFIAQLAES